MAYLPVAIVSKLNFAKNMPGEFELKKRK